jgi:hypothetical protein
MFTSCMRGRVRVHLCFQKLIPALAKTFWFFAFELAPLFSTGSINNPSFCATNFLVGSTYTTIATTSLTTTGGRVVMLLTGDSNPGAQGLLALAFSYPTLI